MIRTALCLSLAVFVPHLRAASAPEAPLPADPMAVSIHHLPNGLTVYLSPYHQEPRITAWLAVRAGSKNDPNDSTGMAHYLEHMLFKGSTHLGTSDYDKERPLLERMSGLYEELFRTKDPAQRKTLYRKIDDFNVAASSFAIPNELDRLYSRLGFSGVNAFTSNERTVFTCDFPANRASSWARVESDRFSQPVFRLFPTEIETVYEEKNRSLDNAERILGEAADKLFWKSHPYGRTVLGAPEHLKNPSLAKMYDFYARNYVPGNMALVLSGDFDREVMLRLIEKHFQAWKPRARPPIAPTPLVRPKGEEKTEVRYEAEEKLTMSWLTVPNRHPDAPAIQVMDMIMDNSAAGIINLDLLQAQKVKSAGSYPELMNEAGAWTVWAVPKKDQTLEQAQALLREAIAKLKSGAFSESDISAVITDFEVSEKHRWESNESRAALMADSFIRQEPWPETVARLDRLRSVTKADVVRVANQYLGPDHTVAYRRQGKPELLSIAKPEFTKLDIKTDRQSRLFEDIVRATATPMTPRWLEPGRDYTVQKLPEGRLYVAANPVNDLFMLNWHFDLGMRQQRDLCAALSLVDLAGAGALSAEEFKKRLYALGTRLNTDCGDQTASVNLFGLEKNLWASLQLVSEHFQAPHIASDTLNKMVQVAIGAHADNKKDPGYIHYALAEFAQQGRESDVLTGYSDAELRALRESDLRASLRKLWGYQRDLVYAGTRPAGELARLVDAGRTRYLEPPARRNVSYLRPGKDKVFFVHRDMLQSKVGMSAGDEKLDQKHYVDYMVLSEYLGGDMSSLIFQEIREARALAYSASGGYSSAARKGDENRLWGDLGTQADKTREATVLLRDLL
ncbi:MAG: insulinase family protein, partial [Elusimicrobiota bacterium]